MHNTTKQPNPDRPPASHADTLARRALERYLRKLGASRSEACRAATALPGPVAMKLLPLKTRLLGMTP